MHILYIDNKNNFTILQLIVQYRYLNIKKTILEFINISECMVKF